MMIVSLNTSAKVGVLFVFVLAGIFLAGLTRIGPGGPTVEAALLSQVKKLVASDAEADDWFGISVAVSGDTAVVGAPGEDAGGSSAGAVYVLQRDQGGANNWGEVKKLMASDAHIFDDFGTSVAISGDTAIVGAQSEQSGIFCCLGAAYVFQRDEGGADNWGEVKKLTASDAQDFDRFGIGVAVSGDTAVVGAYLEDGGPGNTLPDAGAAYVFQRDQGGTDNWGEVKKLIASNAGSGDEFGYSVATNGDTAVVTANREDTGGLDAGAAYVFQRDQGGAGTWGEVKMLTASNAGKGDRFGSHVAISVDTAVLGSPGEDTWGVDTGAAYVFQRDQGGAGTWGEVTILFASDAQNDDSFRSVAISGDTVVVGAWREAAGGFNAGAAYEFHRNQGGADNWGEVKKLTASDTQADDNFGWSVAVSGDTAVVGANGEDGGAGDPLSNAGAAYVFEVLPPKPTSTPIDTATFTPTPTATSTPTPTPTPTKQPFPLDTDGDGCADQRENGPDEALGGQRDYKNPWDFYDVETISGPGTDGVVDLLFDILSVINHYSPTGAPPYDAHYDRGPSAGPNAWNMTAPDGVIDLLNDILGVIRQANHNCT